jgi:hypothetical protein
MVVLDGIIYQVRGDGSVHERRDVRLPEAGTFLKENLGEGWQQ